ncbi:hypothetical protein EV2_036859 [Malus domestica]
MITLNTTYGNFFTCTFTGHGAGVQKLAMDRTKVFTRDPVAKSLLQVERVRGGGDRACPPMPATREQMSATLKMFYLGCCCSTMVQNDDEVVSLEMQVCTEEERADVEVHLLRVCTPCAAGGVWWSEAAENGTKTGGFRDVLEGMMNENGSVDAIAEC